jgi:cytochrome c oxidase cbb3-type subunit IV
MVETYTLLARIAQGAGVLYFMAIFLAVCLYAVWPSNRDRFEAAARTPLQDD